MGRVLLPGSILAVGILWRLGLEALEQLLLDLAGAGGAMCPLLIARRSCLGGGVPFLSPGGGKIVSLVAGLGGTVVPVLASPFSGVWGAKIVELGDSACRISGAHGAGMGPRTAEGCLAFGCQEGCASDILSEAGSS